MPLHGGSSSELMRILANEVPKPRQFLKGMNVRLHLHAVDYYLKQKDNGCIHENAKSRKNRKGLSGPPQCIVRALFVKAD